MLPYATPADERFRARVRAWAERNLAGFDDDTATDDDARRLVRTMGRAGLLKAAVAGAASTKVRGLAVAIAREEIAHASPLVDALFAMQGLGSYPLALGGRPALKRRILPRVADGTLIAAFALTEEEAGSDAAAIRTTARRVKDGWVLNGEKKFISNAGIAGFYSVFARTGEKDGKPAVSAFLVEADSRGLEVSGRTALIAPHPIGRLRFDGCRVAEGALLGREGEGLGLALRTLDLFRPTVGAAACGMARRALDEALARVRGRHQFGRALSDFQGVRFKLADMATRLEGARGLVYRAAWLNQQGEKPTLSSAMAKLAATESAFRVVDDALQLWGGEGLVKGRMVERLYREVRALRIYEGTSEIQRLVIARELLR